MPEPGMSPEEPVHISEVLPEILDKLEADYVPLTDTERGVLEEADAKELSRATDNQRDVSGESDAQKLIDSAQADQLRRLEAERHKNS